MSIPTTEWDETVPLGTEAISNGDDRIRELKTQLREIIEIDHDVESSGQDADWGQHKVIHLQNQPSDPTATANIVHLYQKDADGKPELFIRDEDGNVIQITSAGSLNVDLTSYLTAADTIEFTGDITFDNAVTIPENPTSDTDAACKSYVDGQFPIGATNLTDAVLTFAKMASGSGIGRLAVGTYTGDGNNNRQIAIGWAISSTWVILVWGDSTGSGNNLVIGTSSHPSGHSTAITEGDKTDCIVSKHASDGFVVNRGNDVNRDSRDYYYVVISVA